MVANGSVKVVGRGIGDEIEGQLGELIDCIGCFISSRVKQQDLGGCVPSLGSATASDAFFSSLIESKIPDNRGVTFPSTTAAVCSRAGIVSI